MNGNTAEFRTGVISPVECFKEGWALIKDQYWLFLGIVFVGVMIGGVVPIVLLGPMMVGIYLCYFRRMRGEPVDFNNLFKGFDYFAQGLIAALIQMIPMVVIMVPFYIVWFVAIMASMPRGGGRMDPEDSRTFFFTFFGFEIVFILVMAVVGIAVHIFFMFAFPLIADKNLTGLDAVKLSIKAGKANVGGILLLLLMSAALGILGVLACYVGVFFLMPVTMAAQAVAYRRVFPESTPSYPTPPPPPPPGSWAT